MLACEATTTVGEGSSCPSFLSVHWGFNYRATQEPHYNEKQNEDLERQKERGNVQRGATGINRDKSKPFATEPLNLILPDTTIVGMHLSNHSFTSHVS